MISAAFSHATTSWNSAKPLTLVAMPRLTTALPLCVNRCCGSAVIRPRMRKWLIPYDRDFAGLSVTSPSTSATRSGFRAMDVSSCEVDRVAFGERRAQGRSGNPSPQATCLGGCSADRAVLECHESDQQLTDKGDTSWSRGGSASWAGARAGWGHPGYDVPAGHLHAAR